jgi:hypothetical protein
MNKHIIRKTLCVILALSLVLGTVSIAFGAASPTKGKKPTKDKYGYYVGHNLVRAFNKKTVILKKSVTKINSRAFSKCKNLRTLKIKTTKKVTVSKKAFKGLKKSQLKKIKVRVNKKMSKKNFKKLKTALKKAGIPAKNIKRL